ncbi:MAG: DUF2905 domain-containing protein [Bacteriovorax sp.]|nr:DUF2905 domain-containing protein [Bacteriovorax sp.]
MKESPISKKALLGILYNSWIKRSIMFMDNIAKFLIGFGSLLIICGLIWYVTGGKIPLGRLPGDIRIESENTKFYFPITTSLIVSAILSLLAYLFRK